MNDLNLVFLSQVVAECVRMTSSLTIWKADINTGIYQVDGVSRVRSIMVNTHSESDDFIGHQASWLINNLLFVNENLIQVTPLLND